jgi:TonB family protein
MLEENLLGSTVIQFSLFIVLSLTLHLLCLALNVELPAIPESSDSRKIGYVSMRADSFFPQSGPAVEEKKEPIPIKVAADKPLIVKKGEIAFSPQSVNSKKKKSSQKDSTLLHPSPLPSVIYKDLDRHSELQEVTSHDQKRTVVFAEPLIEKQLNLPAENIPLVSFAEKTTLSSESELASTPQNRLSEHNRQVGPSLQRDDHNASAFQAALPCYDENPPPEYPEVARRRGWAGIVQFEVQVLKSGRVGHLDILASSGYKRLDRAARKSVSRWIFKPATSFGVPVESRVVVPISFVLDN